MGVVQLPRLITGAYICVYVQHSNADIDRMWTCQNITTSIFMNLPYSIFFRMTLYVYYIYKHMPLLWQIQQETHPQ
jgi:hypothetical protein